jgi:hypothetical protein
LQKTLFNLYRAFLEYTSPVSADESPVNAAEESVDTEEQSEEGVRVQWQNRYKCEASKARQQSQAQYTQQKARANYGQEVQCQALAWTDPARAAVLKQEVRMVDLLKGKADSSTLEVVVPFLYELFCKHHNLPVADPSTVVFGQSNGLAAIVDLAEKLKQCKSWQEATSIIERITAEAEKEKEQERRTLPLIQLIEEAVKNRQEDALTVIHSLVYNSNAVIKPGIAAAGIA